MHSRPRGLRSDVSEARQPDPSDTETRGGETSARAPGSHASYVPSLFMQKTKKLCVPFSLQNVYLFFFL
jgi:hypothetical protein